MQAAGAGNPGFEFINILSFRLSVELRQGPAISAGILGLNREGNNKYRY
jgi:hypothetical protein